MLNYIVASNWIIYDNALFMSGFCRFASVKFHCLMFRNILTVLTFSLVLFSFLLIVPHRLLWNGLRLSEIYEISNNGPHSLSFHILYYYLLLLLRSSLILFRYYFEECTCTLRRPLFVVSCWCMCTNTILMSPFIMRQWQKQSKCDFSYNFIFFAIHTVHS